MDAKLYIYRVKNSFRETLGLPDGREIPLPPFGLCNAFLKECAVSPPEEAVLRFLRKFTEDMPGSPPVSPESPVAAVIQTGWKVFKDGKYNPPVNLSLTGLPPDFAQQIEPQLLQLALIWFLKPWRSRKISPSERFTFIYQKVPPLEIETLIFDIAEKKQPDKNILCLLYEAVLSRSRQVPSWLVGLQVERIIHRNSATTGRHLKERTVTARVYVSKVGFLPLCWAEVFYAIENDIHARRCEFCGNWFPLQKTQVGQQKFCSPACRSASKKRRVSQKRKTPQPTV